MTISRPQDITRYPFDSSDQLLLDTNVWLLLYGPQKPNDPRVAIYSQAFARILAAQSRIYIDVLIVSEFINTYARLQWKIRAPSYSNFKQFRRSGEFQPVAQEIADQVKRVLGNCTKVASGFESVEIELLLDTYALGDSDFNDQILANLCQQRGLKLITDDGDFQGRGIPVITANRWLLA